MNNTFEDLIFRAGLSERAERYKDMVEIMKDVVKAMPTEKNESVVKARNLFSVAYKNLAGAGRASWRILSAELAKYENKNEARASVVKEYMGVVEGELHGICDEVLEIIDKHIISAPNVTSNKESMVFFLKMKADYLRYKAEVCVEDQRLRVANLSRDNYFGAMDQAAELCPTNPVKLGLALNYSVFLYEISNECSKACEIAKKAFDDAIAGLDELSEEHYKDSTLIMQLLRDNMTLWTNVDENTKINENIDEEDLEREEENDGKEY
jgi:14-3-3 protein beta/theta/zeta